MPKITPVSEEHGKISPKKGQHSSTGSRSWGRLSPYYFYFICLLAMATQVDAGQDPISNSDILSAIDVCLADSPDEQYCQFATEVDDNNSTEPVTSAIEDMWLLILGIICQQLYRYFMPDDRFQRIIEKLICYFQREAIRNEVVENLSDTRNKHYQVNVQYSNDRDGKALYLLELTLVDPMLRTLRTARNALLEKAQDCLNVRELKIITTNTRYFEMVIPYEHKYPRDSFNQWHMYIQDQADKFSQSAIKTKKKSTSVSVETTNDSSHTIPTDYSTSSYAKTRNKGRALKTRTAYPKGHYARANRTPRRKPGKKRPIAPRIVQQEKPQLILQTELISDNCKQVLMTLHQLNIVAYPAGGMIVDLYQHRQPRDFDLVAATTFEKLLELFPNGKQYNFTQDQNYSVFTIPDPAGDIEITLLTGELSSDSTKRVCTIDALYLDLRAERNCVVDCGGKHRSGVNDLDQQRIRTRISAAKSFRQDPRRILRVIYTAAKTGFKLDDEIVTELTNHHRSTLTIDPKQLLTLCKKLFLNGHAQRCFQLLLQYNLVEELLPNYQQLDTAKQLKAYTMLERVMAQLDQDYSDSTNKNNFADEKLSLLLSALFYYPCAIHRNALKQFLEQVSEYIIMLPKAITCYDGAQYPVRSQITNTMYCFFQQRKEITAEALGLDAAFPKPKLVMS